MVICTGEILADMISRPQADGCVFERYAGGAPFNVACGIAKLGGEAGFYGCVGNDLMGDFLESAAQRSGFGWLRLRRERQRNTTLAFVELSEAGERKFSFYRCETADFCLDVSDIGAIVAHADIVHLGSLPMSEESGRAFCDALIAQAHAAGKKVSFDVNYRADIFDSEARAKEILGGYLRAADIVKVSAEELPLFCGGRDVRAGAACLAEGGKIAFVTCGKDGAVCAAGGEVLFAAAPRVKAVDTTGAGDAFFAGALSVLDRKGCSALAEALEIGCVCGSLTTTRKGAVDAFPDPAQVRAYRQK